MGVTTIEWTSTKRADGTYTPGYSFNPWRGCTKISAGCSSCYADKLSHRNPGVFGVWGPNGTRVVASESMWAQPLKWDRQAKAAGERHRVFCASLADVFEGPETMPAESWPIIQAARVRLFHLINDTPNLDWLLLTKRPENIRRFTLESPGSWSLAMPSNVWLGTSVEDQKMADERIPHLFGVPAAVRFLSMEPLLGPVDLTRAGYDGTRIVNPLDGTVPYRPDLGRSRNTLDWVIVGAESGPKARPMDRAWVRSIRDQCNAAGVPFFFKQELVDGRKFGLPELDGRIWAELPTLAEVAR